jgi:hypothetical protein
VRTVARFVAWTCALEVLWAVLVGTTQSTELIAGVGASIIGALFVIALRRLDLLAFRASAEALRSAVPVLGHVVFDFVLVLWLLVRQLARRERVRGVWLEVPFREQDGVHGRFRRAVAAALENESANGFVVDIDGGRALLHSLDTRVSTGRQVM